MAMAVGPIFRLAGGITGGISASKNRKAFEEMMAALGRPDPGTEQRNWFADMESFYPRASQLSQRARGDELTQNLALREQALPGFGAATGDAMRFIAPLMRGELPREVLAAAARGANANVMGRGMGGTGQDALMNFLYQGQGSMGAMGTGMSLLTRLLGTMPQVSAPTTMGLLGQLMTPQQRIQHQMNLRAQQIGMNTQLASMPTALDSWSSHLNESGAMLMGGGMSGMMGGMGGMGSGGGGGGGMGFNGAGGAANGYWGSNNLGTMSGMYAPGMPLGRDTFYDDRNGVYRRELY